MAALPVRVPELMLIPTVSASSDAMAPRDKEAPLPLPAISSGNGRRGSNRELVRKAGDQLKRAVRRTLRRPDAPTR